MRLALFLTHIIRQSYNEDSVSIYTCFVKNATQPSDDNVGLVAKLITPTVIEY